MQQLIYAGSYTQSADEAGIHIYGFDEDTGGLTLRDSVTGIHNPSFLAISPDRSCLLVVSEVSEFEGTAGGAVYSFALDATTGALTLLNVQPTYGEHPCYVSFDATGRWAFVANYTSGKLTVLPVHEGGRLGEPSVVISHHGHGPNESRQDKAHVHCARVDPLNQALLVVDLGIDQIVSYGLDLAVGRLQTDDAFAAHTEPGAGPRHIDFHPTGRFAYVSNELNSTVAVYALDGRRLTPLQVLSTLPANFKGLNDVADIHLTPDGRYLYVSNRGHDSLAGYAVDAETGLLAPLGFTEVRGHWPRNFSFDLTGAFLLVANQKTDTIVSFRVDAETGALEPTGHQTKVTAPVCVVALRLP